MLSREQGYESGAEAPLGFSYMQFMRRAAPIVSGLIFRLDLAYFYLRLGHDQS